MITQRTVTCPECGYSFAEKIAGNLRTTTLSLQDWLSRCKTEEVASPLECPHLRIEADRAPAPDFSSPST